MVLSSPGQATSLLGPQHKAAPHSRRHRIGGSGVSWGPWDLTAPVRRAAGKPQSWFVTTLQNTGIPGSPHCEAMKNGSTNILQTLTRTGELSGKEGKTRLVGQGVRAQTRGEGAFQKPELVSAAVCTRTEGKASGPHGTDSGLTLADSQGKVSFQGWHKSLPSYGPKTHKPVPGTGVPPAAWPKRTKLSLQGQAPRPGLQRSPPNTVLTKASSRRKPQNPRKTPA